MRVFVVGERHSGTNFLKFCLEHFFPLNVQPPIDRLPYLEPDGKGYHSKHLFKPMTHECDHDNLYIHIVRDPCSWSLAMHRQPRAGSAAAAQTFGHFLSSRWTEHVTRTRYDSVLSLRRHQMQRISSFVAGCAHQERVAFDEFVRAPARFLRAWARGYNLTASGRLCEVRAMENQSLSPAHLALVEAVTNESCAGCCWTARRAVENHVQSLRP